MHGMRGSGEKAKDFKGTLGKLFKYLKPYYVKILPSSKTIIWSADIIEAIRCPTIKTVFLVFLIIW